MRLFSNCTIQRNFFYKSILELDWNGNDLKSKCEDLLLSSFFFKIKL